MHQVLIVTWYKWEYENKNFLSLIGFRVSEDAEVSVDEEDDEHDDKYEDSFIDDRTNPTEASSQTEINGGDMLAFYR